jgi:hypothetical protein
MKNFLILIAIGQLLELPDGNLAASSNGTIDIYKI